MARSLTEPTLELPRLQTVMSEAVVYGELGFSGTPPTTGTAAEEIASLLAELRRPAECLNPCRKTARSKGIQMAKQLKSTRRTPDAAALMQVAAEAGRSLPAAVVRQDKPLVW